MRLWYNEQNIIDTLPIDSLNLTKTNIDKVIITC